MAVYVYETVPASPGEEPVRFEVTQSMKEAALTKHPHTGEKVRRVIVGGYYAHPLSGKGYKATGHQTGGCCGDC